MKMTQEDYILLASVTQEIRGFHKALEIGRLRDGIKYMLNISRHGNLYMQNQKPWVLVKGNAEEKYVKLKQFQKCCSISRLFLFFFQESSWYSDRPVLQRGLPIGYYYSPIYAEYFESYGRADERIGGFIRIDR